MTKATKRRGRKLRGERLRRRSGKRWNTPLLANTKFDLRRYYDHPKIFLDRLIPALRKHIPSADISYNRDSRHFEFKGDGWHKNDTFPPLAYMLDLKPNKWRIISDHVTPCPCDLIWSVYSHGHHSVSIGQPQLLNPFLGVVNIKDDFGDLVSIKYNTVHSLPVSKKHVEIKTGHDSCVNFVFGKTILKLHFKPTKPPP